jgi:ABC-2 type transport system ATP-binding protein
LILDEPAASLDPMGRRDVLAVMERLRKHTTVFYSTHLLDDVQRVSDSVAILNHGRLVAEAPIAQLLDGSGATVYVLSVTGDVDAIRARIARQPWVTSVTAGPSNGTTPLQVGVSDAPAAEARLVRLVLEDPVVTVTAFGRKRHNLEEIFLEVVEGGTAHGNA